MPRFSGGAKTSTAGTTLRPLMSLYGAAGSGAVLREVHVSNTTDTALDVKLARLTAATGQGASITLGKQDPNGGAAACTLRQSHTADATVGEDLGYRATIGAAKGSGWIFTFGDRGLIVPAGTANGIGLLIENGTGQIVQATFVWDE